MAEYSTNTEDCSMQITDVDRNNWSWNRKKTAHDDVDEHEKNNMSGGIADDDMKQKL